MKIIVTAGGQGTKLWPYSREDKPKQFQPVVGDKSLYTETIETLLKKFAPEDIFISTKRKFIKYISEQSPQIPLKNYIIEPDVAKDRGPGEGLAFLKLSVYYPDEPFFVVQADCVRKPEEAFLQMIEEAGKIVERDKKYITGGLKATEPNMGVDYLQLGEKVAGSKQEMYEVQDFLGRKSSYRETKELIENFHIVTHCNHSCWYPGLMLEAYKQYRPDWYEALMRMKDALDQPGEDAAIEEIYETMEKGATEEVTKHLMKNGDARIILLPFKWTDIGTWGSVYEFFVDGDDTGNYKDGHVVAVDTTGSLVKASNDKKLVAIAGLEDVVVIDTDDVLLVIAKDKIEKIKDIQTALKDDGDKEYL
ncbi:MAG TPA: sugar phosphate nucleotidyltransferase [Candidatus Saccharimonadales bacterium]|nr:sugar phosphate nucleotidyltransferase [Candidatus Saccharimonadales bacterium]